MSAFSVAARLNHVSGKVSFKNIKTIFNIGAWYLDESFEFYDLFKDATIYTFEPNPQNYERCIRELEARPECKDRIKIINIAASDITGKVKFYPLDDTKTENRNYGISSMFKLLEDHPFPTDNWAQKEIEVDATRMDKFCEENNLTPDIVWMDVQGAELLVLKGFGDKIKHVRVILTEAGLKPYYEGHTLKSEIDEYMFKNNFELVEEANQFNGHDYEQNVIYINKGVKNDTIRN